MSVWSNLKNLLTDLTGRTVPNQYYNPTTDQMEVVQGSGGAPNMQLAGSKVTNGVLYNQVAANQTGAAATITLPQGNKTLILSVFGDATAAGTLSFMAAGPDGNYGAITGTKLNGFSQATSTASFPQTSAATGVDLWKFDVSGLATVQAPLTWTAGHVSVDWSVMP